MDFFEKMANPESSAPSSTEQIVSVDSNFSNADGQTLNETIENLAFLSKNQLEKLIIDSAIILDDLPDTDIASPQTMSPESLPSFSGNQISFSSFPSVFESNQSVSPVSSDSSVRSPQTRSTVRVLYQRYKKLRVFKNDDELERFIASNNLPIDSSKIRSQKESCTICKRRNSRDNHEMQREYHNCTQNGCLNRSIPKTRRNRQCFSILRCRNTGEILLGQSNGHMGTMIQFEERSRCERRESRGQRLSYGQLGISQASNSASFDEEEDEAEQNKGYLLSEFTNEQDFMSFITENELPVAINSENKKFMKCTRCLDNLNDHEMEVRLFECTNTKCSNDFSCFFVTKCSENSSLQLHESYFHDFETDFGDSSSDKDEKKRDIDDKTESEGKTSEELEKPNFLVSILQGKFKLMHLNPNLKSKTESTKNDTEKE